MKAAFITGKESVQVHETETPAPGSGEALVRVRACGICGTDLHFYHGVFPGNPSVSLGHEFSGEVEALGEGVEGFERGDRVVVEPIRRCQDCSSCRTGRYHLCPGRAFLGTVAPGGMAEHLTVPAYMLYRLPDEIDFELAALVEPLAVAVHGVHLVDLRMGERVLVLGSGTIGLLSIVAARAAGAGEVLATYRHEHQGQAALAAGATRVVNAEELGSLGRGGIDVVIETVGGAGAATLQQALGFIRPGGRVSVLGVFMGPLQIDGLRLVLNEAKIAAGITYCRPGMRSDFDVALRILHGNREGMRRLITHRFPLAEAGEAFATAADKGTKSLKVQVIP
jgi:2-desacetyl-2-hydroxyethyl bacteriochlorophyllide A dehydrogenase